MTPQAPTTSLPRRLRFTAALVCILVLVFSIHLYGDRQHEMALERTHQSRLLGDQLRQSADELTRLTRAYILTGNALYKKEYLAIRAVLGNAQSPPDSSLTGLSTQVKFSDAAFRQLAHGKPEADMLMRTEAAAMALVEHPASDLDARRTQASQLLEDAHYQDLKLSLAQHTPEYLALVDLRTQLALENSWQTRTLLEIALLLLALGLVLSLWRALHIWRATLGGSLEEVHGQIVRLGKGHFTDVLAVGPTRQDSVLGWLAQAQQQLAQIASDHQKSELKLQHLARLYAALSHFNQAIVRCTSEQALFEKICWAAVAHGGMKMAWIGLADPQTRSIRPTACFGIGSEYLQGIGISTDAEDASGRGPTGTAYRQNQPYWCQDFQGDPVTAPWHAPADRFGWAASAALPLRRGGVAIGVLTVYAGEVHAFDRQAQQLLLEMVSDMDYAIRNFEREAERKLSRTQNERARQKDDLRNFMVERLTSDATLNQILQDVVLELEKQLPHAQCAILLIDVQAQRLAVSAAPSLPDFFSQALDGMSVGPHGGGFATAALTGQRVVVEDIATHPDWSNYQEMARRAGLVSCWSEPIRSGSQQVLGNFAIHHRKRSTPKRHELELLEMAARLTALAIERKRTETQLQLAAKVFERGSESIMVTDSRGRIVRVSHAFSQTTGYSEAEALGRNPSMLSSGRHDADFFKAMWAAIHAHGQWQGEIWNRRKDGAVYPERLSISSLLDSRGEISNYVAVGTDITQHKKDEEHIRQLVDFDPLTGLPNRHSLRRRVESELLYAQRCDEPLALMFLDLDRFKNVNDSLGHHIGDALLIQIAQRLQSVLRDQDTVYHLGGDEFVVLCPGLDATAAAQMANRVLKITAQGYSVEQHDLATTFSIGIALFPTDGDSYETLSRSADTAMYRAKQAGRNAYRFFTAHMQVQSSRALQLENGLRRALELRQMHLVYQPQVSLHDGQVIGMEALLRWEHPTLGAISPSEFIPVAEDSGLILSIGEWVLRTATQQLRSWLDAGLAMQVISVNLSVVQFRHANLPELITQVLLDAGLPPHYLELELTEGVAMDDPLNAIAVMDKLSQRGVRLSIDDFGTGYSSLSYLKRFSVYKLKIDQSFVRDITDDPDDKAIVVAIIALAHSMGFKTIAEGVETQGQLDFLREQGCDDVQGYFYSKPLLPAAFEAFVRQHPGP